MLNVKYDRIVTIEANFDSKKRWFKIGNMEISQCLGGSVWYSRSFVSKIRNCNGISLENYSYLVFIQPASGMSCHNIIYHIIRIYNLIADSSRMSTTETAEKKRNCDIASTTKRWNKICRERWWCLPFHIWWICKLTIHKHLASITSLRCR